MLPTSTCTFVELACCVVLAGPFAGKQLRVQNLAKGWLVRRSVSFVPATSSKKKKPLCVFLIVLLLQSSKKRARGQSACCETSLGETEVVVESEPNTGNLLITRTRDREVDALRPRPRT